MSKMTVEKMSWYLMPGDWVRIGESVGLVVATPEKDGGTGEWILNCSDGWIYLKDIEEVRRKP